MPCDRDRVGFALNKPLITPVALSPDMLLQFANSVVNAGLYRDDADDGEELTYTGECLHCCCSFMAPVVVRLARSHASLTAEHKHVKA